MFKYLLVGSLCAFSMSALCQPIDYEATKARVTYEAVTIWIDNVGPALGLTIRLRGQINSDAVFMVRRSYDTLILSHRRYYEEMNLPSVGGEHAINIQLDSMGGSVESAIEIGRFLRDKNVTVLVTKEARCASACVFVLAGGVRRRVDGNLGVHRPFLETPTHTTSAEDVKRAATQTKERIRAYFREMNISERLADDMMAIPSNEIRWLSPEQIAFYGLGADDPVISETNALREAQKYGLTRIEYEVRRKRAQELCTIGSPPGCKDKIMREGPQPFDPDVYLGRKTAAPRYD
jgi:hypothetical protein